MKSIKWGILTCLLLLVAGCATQPEKPPVSGENEKVQEEQNGDSKVDEKETEKMKEYAKLFEIQSRYYQEGRDF